MTDVYDHPLTRRGLFGLACVLAGLALSGGDWLVMLFVVPLVVSTWRALDARCTVDVPNAGWRPVRLESGDSLTLGHYDADPIGHVRVREAASGVFIYSPRPEPYDWQAEAWAHIESMREQGDP